MRTTRGWHAAVPIGIFLVGAAIAIAAFVGAARPATASPPELTLALTSEPPPSEAVPLSTAAQSAYIRYAVTVANPGRSTWHEVVLTDPAPSTSLHGATIVFVANCPNGPNGRVSLTSVTCIFGRLAGGAAPTPVTIVVRTPTHGTQLVNTVRLTGDEGDDDAASSDNHSQRHDTFVASVTNPLTANTQGSATSWALPGQTLRLKTDPHLSASNPQVTAGRFPSVATLPEGYLVGMSETAVGAADTCNGNTPTSPLISNVDVSADPSNFTTHPLRFVFTILVPPGTYDHVSDVVVCHRTTGGFVPVPHAGHGTDPTGDSISDVDFLNASHTVVEVTADGPSNGAWGTW